MAKLKHIVWLQYEVQNLTSISERTKGFTTLKMMKQIWTLDGKPLGEVKHILLPFWHAVRLDTNGFSSDFAFVSKTCQELLFLVFADEICRRSIV